VAASRADEVVRETMIDETILIEAEGKGRI